jgi:hypothetical protein
MTSVGQQGLYLGSDYSSSEWRFYDIMTFLGHNNVKKFQKTNAAYLKKQLFDSQLF